jgi:DNA mismatch repair protein MutL
MSPPRIQILPPQLAGQIAAGEVVERPASVVKELLENALDAGATRVVVELDQGGRERIRVVDDGCGIVTEDLPLVFARHATSKLQQAQDLERIRTLGFRGEALSAIGSVARVCIQSRTAEAELGGQIECVGGQVGCVQPWAGPVGTCVEVRQLFFNTPARRKFLRSVPTELGQVLETVQRLALAFPGVHFRLLHHSREVLEVPASWGKLERIANFFGEKLADRLMPVEYAVETVRVSGWVGHPDCARPNGRWQYFFVNQRAIRDRTLTHALQEAYRGYLMVGRQPVAFLYLELPPELVDVNVHPTKTEVRFRQPQIIHQAVLLGVRRALQGSPGVSPLAVSSIVAATASDSADRAFRVRFEPAGRMRAPYDQYRQPTEQRQQAPQQPAPGKVEEPIVTRTATETSIISQQQAQNRTTESSSQEKPLSATSESAATTTLFPIPPALRAMQLHNTYLLAETSEGLLLIDQHALHERILYEQFKSQVQAGALPKQALLIPEPVDLTPAQAAVVVEQRSALEALGLEVSEFGGSTVLVHALPACWKRSATELVQLAAEYFAEHHRLPELPILLDDLLKRMACRAAIKAGDPLGAEEIAMLLEYHARLPETHHCPHGRPTALFLSKQELERQFGRV